jgi:microcystin-dependent protein
MSEPFLGQLQIYGFSFAPRGWSLCNGQTLSISQYAALFSLLGTTYGGNGVSTFQLPNMQSRVPMHFGNGAGLTPRVLGEQGGEENHTLLTTEMAAHNHIANASTAAGTQSSPSGATLGQSNTGTVHTPVLNVPNFVTTAPNAPLAASTIANAGGSQGHPNIQPYLTVNYCIAMVGVFPSRN